MLSRKKRSLGLALACFALAAHAAPPEEKAVVARLQGLLDGLAKRDKVMMSAQLLPGGSATLMRNGKAVQMTFDAFVDRLSTPGTDTREERIHNPLVRVDRDIAIIWTPFEFLTNGKIDHCGTDIVNLVKVDGQWLIASVADTSRTDCKKR
jgi:putative lumazine-binding protein